MRHKEIINVKKTFIKYKPNILRNGARHINRVPTHTLCLHHRGATIAENSITKWYQPENVFFYIYSISDRRESFKEQC